MSGWPAITEPELLERLAMSDSEFEAFARNLATQIPSRAYEKSLYLRAVEYPWARPEGSFQVTSNGVEPLADLSLEERHRVIRRFTSPESGRTPVLAIGSNGAPEVLEQKLAHFADAENRAVLALSGRLHDFDVGASAHLALYGAMPATLFPSPRTEVRAAILWVTPTQLTQLAWSEINYWLGRLQTRFEADEAGMAFDEVLVFVSRFGAFCVDGRPVALAAIPATGRSAEALTQKQLLDTAAELALGAGASGETLVRAIFEDVAQTALKIAATVWRASLPFASERWAPFTPR